MTEPVVTNPNAPPQGNAIVNSSALPWHSVLIGAFVVGISIWVVEQNFSSNAAWGLAALILLGVMYKAPGFTAELNSLVFKGGAS